MKKTTLLTLIAMTILAAGCRENREKPQPLTIDNALSAEEIEAGILTPEVLWKMGRIGEAVLSPDGTKLLYTVTYYNMQENRGVSSLYLQEIAGGEPQILTDNAGSESVPQWSRDGKSIYFLSDRSGSQQIWHIPANGGRLTQLTDIENGIDGFGIAPSGDKLSYISRVQVKEVNSADVYKDMNHSKARIYDDLMARHWNYWDDGSYLHIFVASLSNNRIGVGKDIMEGEPWDAPMAPYFDLAEIAWNHAGTQLAYTCKKQTGTAYALSTDSDIFLYDVATDSTHNICKTEAPADPREAIVPPMPGYDKYPLFSPDDKRIAFRSMRRAGNESDKERLFIWDSETGQFSDLTAEFEHSANNVAWDGNDRLYFTSAIEATRQLCRVGMDGKVEVLTSGDHDINTITLANNTLICGVTKHSMATELFRIDPNTGTLQQITFVNKPIYDHIRMGRSEKRWVETTDGKQMLVWVILPPDFDSTKTYPTLLYCEGGPQSVVSQFWSYRWNFQLMAAQGYVVVAPNRRGLPSFGQEWLDQISGDYSGQNIRDYLSAIDDVAKEPWADADRMGCVGASYGGYSVFFLAGHHEDRFKAFIAHCGIFDFESMYGETEELWFVNRDYGGSYWDKDPVAVRSYANSPHKFIEKWNTPILIFTGEKDFRIPYTQSLEAFTGARLMGVPSRLVVFEDEAHQVFKPQNSLTWNREFFGWLDRYVKNPDQK